MKLWVAGKVLNIEAQCWEIEGIFDSENKAVAVCKNSDYFVGPLTLNKKTPTRSVDWPGAYYPIKEK